MKHLSLSYLSSLKCLWLFFCCSAVNNSRAQQATRVADIEKLYEAKQYAKATQLLGTTVADLLKAGNADSLTNYIIWTGKLENKKTDAGQAIQKVNALIVKVKSLTGSATTISQAYIEAGEFFGLLSKNEMGYHASQQALKYAALASDELRTLRLANIENNMSTFAQRMGDISLSISHGRKALQWISQSRKPDYEKLYLIYNSMGTGMYYLSKLDSGIYYFNKALDALSKAQPTPQNKYYRPAIIQNNIAGIYGLQGKLTADIAAMKVTINYLKLFLATKEPHPKKQNAVEFQFEATDNLAGIYKELGDYKQAHQLLDYSYQQKQQQLPVGSAAVFKSEILLGQLYFAMREFEKAILFLNRGLAKMAVADGDYLFWQADACSTLALLYEAKKENTTAASFYQKADSLYEESLQGAYDNIYLEFLTNAATFYAATGQEQTAVKKAKKGYNYVVKTQGAQSLAASYQLLNLSQVYYLSGHYRFAFDYANKALTVMNSNARSSQNLLDSITVELKKPNAILAKTKATYQLLPKKDVAHLSVLLKELEEALALLERRKMVIGDVENTGLLVADYNELLEFVKKLNFDLFQLTKNTTYIDRMVELHEAGIYNRIRSRLDENDSLQFVHVPAATQATEKKLKTRIATALEGDETPDVKMRYYLTALEAWNRFQQDIRVKYPRYYKMRYGSIFKSLSLIQQRIPAGTAVVRYFYIDTNLYAMVADAGSKNVFALQSQGIEKHITALSQRGLDAAQTGELLNALYHQLWAPISGSIHTPKLVIIPDGILYNLNFEILTSQKIAAFKELTTKSLMANYTISYNYSLFLLEPIKRGAEFRDNFVAFTPGFSDDVKYKYKSSVKKGDPVDNDYLSLLPQPFTIDLATKIQKIFGGSVYANDQSTAASFKANAGRHKIIHIGTHAESDNLHPEYSRLIFIKGSGTATDSNSLFLPQIYNCDLTSGLTVLTACESGRPGYKDGEGMISLAHAFNYAGSESILTSLWKIDEQASMLLVDAFYKHLAAGLAKDEALRQAKISYLQNNEGRMLATEYWAGLIIMGDTTPLQLQPNRSFPYYRIAAGVLLLAITVYLSRMIRNYFAGRND